MLTPATSAMRVVVAASSPSRSRICTVASRMARTVSCARACCGCFRALGTMEGGLLGRLVARHAARVRRGGGRTPDGERAVERVEVLVRDHLVARGRSLQAD